MEDNKKWFLVTNKHDVTHILFDNIQNIPVGSSDTDYSSRSCGYDTEESLRKDEGILDDCKICHGLFKTHWMEPTKSRLIANHTCFTCDFWLEQSKRSGSIIVEGIKYSDGGKVDKSNARGFVGFGGREFKIKMLTGELIETNNLWCQGEIPERFRESMPDNAEFI